MKQNVQNVICEMYGYSINNKFIEYILINQGLDYAVCDMAEELEVSKPKAYEVVYDLEKKGYLIKSRVIGKTQLYKLNEENKRVKLLIKAFKESLLLILQEYEEKKQAKTKRAAVSAAKKVK